MVTNLSTGEKNTIGPRPDIVAKNNFLRIEALFHDELVGIIEAVIGGAEIAIWTDVAMLSKNKAWPFIWRWPRVKNTILIQIAIIPKRDEFREIEIATIKKISILTALMKFLAVVKCSQSITTEAIGNISKKTLYQFSDENDKEARYF